MKYVGIDLHKQTISVCAVTKDRQVLIRKRFFTRDTDRIRAFFAGLGEFQMVCEATGSYEWLFRLLEPLAARTVLAHPGKLRVIAQSTRKSDRHDAQALAERLAEDAVPQSYRPTPRQRDHRRLVRQRIVIQRKITAAKNRLRRLLTDYNADVRHLFSAAGREHFAQVPLSEADRFIGQQYWLELEFYRSQLRQIDQRIAEFAQAGSPREQEARALLRTIPGVGPITTEVVLAELADVSRFGSQKAVAAYAGLAPGQRESAGKRQELHIEKKGSTNLRWVVCQAAWQLVRRSQRWQSVYRALKARMKAQKAITAIARRLLCLMTAILKSGQPYQLARPLPIRGAKPLGAAASSS
jgi:transposase